MSEFSRHERELLRAWWALCVATGGSVHVYVDPVLDGAGPGTLVTFCAKAYGTKLKVSHATTDLEARTLDSAIVRNAQVQCRMLLREVMHLRFSREQIVDGWGE